MPTLPAQPDRDPRLDGLRAVAIIVVVLFHLEMPLAGGFLGVDLFFVLSGFLIAQNLVRADETGALRPRAFYQRRIGRLVPSLLIVLAAVVALAPFALLPEDLSFLGQSLLSTALLAPNVFFWSSFDYFSTVARESPLLHLWSLGVEAQFYLIAPWLILARRRIGPARWKFLFIALMILSFATSLYAQGHHPKAGFYLLPTRLWQFGVGAALAVWAIRFGPWATWTGMAFVCLGFLGGELTSSLGVLFVTIGAGLLISAPANGPIGNFLHRRWLGWIGQRAYTLYLWHWPLIVLAGLRWGPVDTAAEKVALALVSVVFAAATTHFIERRYLSGVRIKRLVLGAGGVVICGVILTQQSFWQGLYPTEIATLSAYTDYRTQPEFKDQTQLHQCFIIDSTEGGVRAFDHPHCLPQPDGRPRILLIGDSHAAHLSGALRAKEGWQILQVTMAGCRPLNSTPAQGGCARLMREALRDLRPDMIVFSARWQQAELAQLQDTIADLAAPAVVLGPVPEYTGGLPRHLARDIWTGRQSAGWQANEDTRQLDQHMQRALAGVPVTYVSMFELLCPEGPCRTMVNGVPIQFDYGHFTQEGAAAVAALIEPVLARKVLQSSAENHGGPVGN